MNHTGHWLEALRAGDDEAWAPLLERYRPFVMSRLRQAVAARNWFWLGDLDDAAQDVMIRFYEAVRNGRFTYRNEDQLRGYLVRTAFYVAMKQKDAVGAERPFSDLSDDEFEAAVERFDLNAFAASAFDPLGHRECLRELYAAIDQLQPARREVLRYTLLGLQPKAIAHRMERTANAVSVLKHHALEDLREALAETTFFEECGQYFLARETGS